MHYFTPQPSPLYLSRSYPSRRCLRSKRSKRSCLQTLLFTTFFLPFLKIFYSFFQIYFIIEFLRERRQRHTAFFDITVRFHIISRYFWTCIIFISVRSDENYTTRENSVISENILSSHPSAMLTFPTIILDRDSSGGRSCCSSRPQHQAGSGHEGRLRGLTNILFINIPRLFTQKFISASWRSHEEDASIFRIFFVLFPTIYAFNKIT